MSGRPVPPPARQAGERVWAAPLVPAAVAVTAGLIADRFLTVPLPLSLTLTLAGIGVAILARPGAGRTSPGRPAVVFAALWAALAGAGAAAHHRHVRVFDADDIGGLTAEEPRPVRLRGVIDEEPVSAALASPADPLRSFPRQPRSTAVLSVSRLRQADVWVPVSGRVHLTAPGSLESSHVGDSVEVLGRLASPGSPANPGEFDYRAFLADQRIRAVMSVPGGADGVIPLADGPPWSPALTLATVRGLGRRQLERALPADVRGLAVALLLGDGSGMSGDDWDVYLRTGVIHVLAISGQHLVVLAAAFWLVLPLFGGSPARGGWVVTGFLVAYALVAGFRPPVVRAAVTAGIACGGAMFRLYVTRSNAFAMAWIAVAVVNPTDVFGNGCQLSFLSVAVLGWGGWVRGDGPVRGPEGDAARLEQHFGSPARRWLAAWIGDGLRASLAVWLAVAPLVAARYHLVSPVAVALGLPLTLLTSIALISGFGLLTLGAVGGPPAWVFAEVTTWSLRGCAWLAGLGDRVPGGHVFVGDVPEWWLWVFYLGLLGGLFGRGLRAPGPWLLAGGLGWLGFGMLLGTCRPAAPSPDELRVTFLAVGHGGCTVLELPDGRTFLYDAGSIGGPEVGRRVVAPFLWNRGVRRIDEAFLSHADLDHFNAVPDLLSRFTVGQVTTTPTFRQKSSPGVRAVLAGWERLGTPVRTVARGDVLVAGHVSIEVLHPPPRGPDGNENSRSLVLLVRHEGHTILLTGDLEGPGLDQVLGSEPPRVDVMMAPHHGSRLANTPELAAWARPRLAVSCQGPPRWPARTEEPYGAVGGTFVGTWPHGAVMVSSRPGSLTAETHSTGRRWRVR